MEFFTGTVLEALFAGTKRNRPIRAHLNAVVAGFERLVIERVVFAFRFARGPDQRLVSVGKASPAKVWHRIRFTPYDIIEDPVSGVLKERADPEDIVVGSDDPERCRRLHHPAAGEEPGARAIVVDGVHARIVWALEIALQLQVIRRIGKDEIDALGRQL